MARVQFLPGSLCTAAEVANNLREGDREEIRALGINEVTRTILSCHRESAWCRAAYADGKLACIFGVSKYGAPWMVGTPVLDRHAKSLVKEARPVVAEMQRLFPKGLTNIVWSKNIKAIRWLEALGFSVNRSQQLDPGTGEIFYPFFLHRQSHVR